MLTPQWAASVVQNYRRLYKEKFDQVSKLNDDQIWIIFNSVFDDTSSKLQDDARVDAMREKEETFE